MLSFLVTSRVRRRLLQLIWGEHARGTASVLAERSGVGFASAYRELQAMRSYHLVTTVVSEGREVYTADPELNGADARVLRHLARSRPQATPPRDADTARVRAQLRLLGAPLQVEPANVSAAPEDTLAEGAHLAHRDPTVARVLPLCVSRARPKLDPDRLLRAAKRVREKQAVGFFLDLTGELTHDPDLCQWAERFRDRRVRQPRDFFQVPRTKGSRELADQRTPDVARRWSYRMNMGLDAFQAPLEKFAHVAG